ncbi:hypothetical protein BHE74_00011800 [Ensete ventricosum]|nr:hypothetical protein BHE74_00011800 [Ensete ventricosum]
MGFKEARASNDQATTTKELTHAAKQQLTGRETADARRQATTLRGCRQAITYSASVPITSRVTTSRATGLSARRYTLSVVLYGKRGADKPLAAKQLTHYIVAALAAQLGELLGAYLSTHYENSLSCRVTLAKHTAASRRQADALYVIACRVARKGKRTPGRQGMPLGGKGCL